MNSFAPGEAGGGNLGFAIDYRTDITVLMSLEDGIEFKQNLSKQRKNELRIYTNSILTNWRKEKYVHTYDGYQIKFNRITEPHIGVASFSSIHFCIVLALNHLEGIEIGDTQLRKYLHDRYKEVVDNELVDGFTTGLSSVLNFHGGFALINESLESKYLLEVPKWRVYLVKNQNLTSRSFGLEEFKTLMGNGRSYDLVDIEEKRGLLKSLKESIKSNDLKLIGDYVRKIQSIGGKKAEIELYGELIKDTLNNLYNEGLECCYLSAVGPGIVVFSEKADDYIYEILSKYNLDIIHKGTIDNNGLVINKLMNSRYEK